MQEKANETGKQWRRQIPALEVWLSSLLHQSNHLGSWFATVKRRQESGLQLERGA